MTKVAPVLLISEHNVYTLVGDLLKQRSKQK